MRVPPEMMISRMGGMVTAVTEVDSKLIMMLDVEKVLSETTGYDDEFMFRDIKPIGRDLLVFFCDDSSVARKQIERTLKVLGLRYVAAVNGRLAWEELEKVAATAEVTGRKVWEMVSLVLTDVEMPEMDGYILTRKIKTDPRFDGVPVLMHSSLSSSSNQTLGKSVGVDGYVPKFEPNKLADAIRSVLAPEQMVA